MPLLDYPHIITANGAPARLERLPRIRVAQIATDYIGRGWSAEEIVLQYPHLTLAEVHSALAYYFDHREELDGKLAHELADAERSRHEQPEGAVIARLRALKREQIGATIAERAARVDWQRVDEILTRVPAAMQVPGDERWTANGSQTLCAPLK